MKQLIQKLYVVLQLMSLGSLLIPTPLHAKPDKKLLAKKYVIGAHQGGFFAAFLAVLNHLAYCEKTHKTPVVYWGDRSWYYLRQGFNGSHNVWEYYFKPVSTLLYDPKKDMTHASYDAGNGQFHYTALDDNMRHKAHTLIAKYIRIQPIIQKKIDTFYQKHMHGKHTIGIHLRGTDKLLEVQPVPVEKIIAAALEHAHHDTQFLIASDEQRLIERAIQLLSGYRVIFYDCYRSTNSQPLHNNHQQCYDANGRSSKPTCAQLGEDVLVEAALFARCDVLVHTGSNVSAAAFYFNPNLKNSRVI